MTIPDLSPANYPAEPDPVDLDAVSDGEHEYLSTGCFHGRHEYCRAMTGYQGEKRPAACKFCDARCVCPCHTEPRDG